MTDDTARVYIADDCCGFERFGHERFRENPPYQCADRDMYDVPGEQLARWDAAETAWIAARQEMTSLVAARAEQQRAQREERQRREDARRAEIRAGLYGGRRTT